MHQSAQAFRRSLIRRALLIFFMAFGVHAPIVFAQESASPDRERAAQLFKSGKYIEALPLLEKLAAANPKDGSLQAQAGIANFVASNAARDETEEKRLRLRARAMLGEAKNLGVQDALVDEIFAAIPLDGGGRSKLSENAEANKLMREGEAAYSRNELDKARALYEQAFALDQKSYLAALFAGDMYFKLGYTEKDAAKKTRLLTEAGVWFAKAIAIDPNVETAYRYWGSALMTQGKMSEAREKVVEAFITNPYTRLSPEGLYRWANMMSITPAHPNIQIPVSVARKDEKNISVTLDQKMIDEKKRRFNRLGQLRSRAFRLDDKQVCERISKRKNLPSHLARRSRSLALRRIGS